MALEQHMVTTAFDLPGYRVTNTVGIARGIVVRSRSIVGAIGAGLQTIVGGNITLYEKMCEDARRQAFERLLAHAENQGANAIVGMRYDATELGAGTTEVLAYGTGVVVEKA